VSATFSRRPKVRRRRPTQVPASNPSASNQKRPSRESGRAVFLCVPVSGWKRTPDQVRGDEVFGKGLNRRAQGRALRS
jgi:hypothetical protein